MIDATQVKTAVDGVTDHSQAYFREAPWLAKRMILGAQLAKQAHQNQQAGIGTSVIAYDITDSKSVYRHGTDDVHWAASLSKLFVTSVLLDDLRAGTTTLDTVITWTPADQRAGAGIYDAPGAPTSATVGEVLFDMLNHSGNTAVRAIVNKVLGGAPAVN